MDLGTFRGAEDIDKSQIIIRRHAKLRFMEHLNEVREKFGFWPEKLPDNLAQAEITIHKLLLNATHKNASWSSQRIRAIMEYDEQTYFLRNGRWQFRIIHGKEKLWSFVLKTVVWLDDYYYSLCFQK